MTLPIWITPAGNLGTIPEEVFFRQPLRAETAANPTPASCTASVAGSDIILCDTTAGAAVGNEVRFFGAAFGGLQENVTYYVLSIPSATTFTITATANGTTPVALSSATGLMTARFYQRVFYSLQSGTLPNGIQLAGSGLITGVPLTTVTVQGVPTVVSQDVTSKFTVRAYTEKTVGGVTSVDRIADRTFTLTITGDDTPDFTTPAGNIGTFYDGDEVDIQIGYSDVDPSDTVVVRLIAGQLPLGLTLTPAGRIVGYIKPFPNVDEPVGYDLTPSGEFPYDFITSSISKNYQFTLEVTDGKGSSIRTFKIYVYNRNDITADNNEITADDTAVTADETTERQPFLINAVPGDLGIVRGDNYFAYRFIGQDYDTELLEYAISVDQGFGLPPGLELDPYTGWYYGFVPDVEITEVTYSFFIQVRARSLVCTATDGATNVITCDQTTRGDFYVGSEITFEGETFGGIIAGVTYYVAAILSDTEFQVTTDPLDPVFDLDTGSGRMLCVPAEISASRLYPFTVTITGTVDREVTWLTDPDLGILENGDVSLLRLEAVNRGGQTLFYQLASGQFNELPQGLQLLPSGDISGRVTFNTFAIDLGTTTFDFTQSTELGIDPTTFDTIFRFTANAFAVDPQQPLFKVSAVRVLSGGSGYTSAPVVEFDAPIGSTAVRATATAVVALGQIQAVVVTNAGANYTETARITLSGGGGSGAVLEVIMQGTGVRRIISSDQEFTVRVARTYNKPYQDLYVSALPTREDRELLRTLLDDSRIFNPDYIFRASDPYFGLSSDITYLHAVGLEPETLEVYVQSLALNHYWKNLTLGAIETARAVDASGNVIYEVVYSRIIDDLVNSQGQSVNSIVTTPYAFDNPNPPPDLINSVYPNSLINMRDRVIDVVGQISDKLPLWMTSTQSSGLVLGYIPAWVICYTKPGRSREVAYYLDLYFGDRLNLIDFKVDRYVLDTEMSRNWDPAAQDWTPTPSLTTFDRVNTTGFTDVGAVNACTELAFVEVNGRTIDDINALGGLDGSTWVAKPGQSPPTGTRVIIRNGSLVIFVRQEFFPRQDTIAEAFTDNIDTFDENEFDSGDTSGSEGTYDYGRTVPGGSISTCTATSAVDDFISCASTLGMTAGDKAWFTGSVFGGVTTSGVGGSTRLYYVRQVSSLEATATISATDEIVVDSTTALEDGDEIWFGDFTLGGISPNGVDGSKKPYYVLNKSASPPRFQIAETPGGAAVPLTDDSASGENMSVYLPAFQLSLTSNLADAVSLDTDSGTMFVNYNNLRLAIYRVTIGDNETINLTVETQTIANDYVTSTQGRKYTNGTQLYHTPIPQLGLSRNSWAPLITASPVIASETTWDEGSVQWVEPVDMYDPGDTYDKYLVFPKVDILQ